MGLLTAGKLPALRGRYHSATPVYEGDNERGLELLQSFKESQKGDEKLRSPTALYGLAGQVEPEAGGERSSGQFFLRHIGSANQGLAPRLAASSLPDSASSLEELEKKQLIYILEEIKNGILAVEKAKRDKNSSVDIEEQIERAQKAIASKDVSKKVLDVLEDCKLQELYLEKEIEEIVQYPLDSKRESS